MGFKNFFLKLLDPLLLKIERRNQYLRKEILEKKKQEILLKFQSIGKEVILNGEHWNFRMPKNIIIGNNVHIGNNAYFHGEGGLTIGDNVHFSRNVTIYTVNHNYKGASLPYDYIKIPKPVIIEKNVWIGMNVSIIPGVTIGEGAIIGLGTIVTKSVAPFEIIGNSPNITIGSRQINHYNILENKKSYGGISGLPMPVEVVSNYFPTYLENRDLPIVFVLGTGRSGSTSIVDMLNQHPSCVAFHENIRQLIRISTLIAHDKEKEKTYLEELNSIFKIKTWNASKQQIMIHSDQRLWNLIPYLKNYFPNSKFIHLIRNPHDCIKSMISRGWYQKDEYPNINDHDWAKYRIQGDVLGFFSSEVWENMGPIQKCTWYWWYLNNEIKKSLQKLPKNQIFTVQLSNLKSNMSNICEFMEIENFEFIEHISNKMNKAQYRNYEKIISENVDYEISLALKNYNF